MTKRMVTLAMAGFVALAAGSASALVLHGIPGGDFSEPNFPEGKPIQAFDGGYWAYHEGQASMPCDVVGMDADRHAEICKEATYWNTSMIWYTDDTGTPTGTVWKISADLHSSYLTAQPMKFELLDAAQNPVFQLVFSAKTVTWIAGSASGSFTSATGLDTTWRTTSIQYDPMTGEAVGTFGDEEVFSTATAGTGLTIKTIRFAVTSYASIGTLYIDNVVAENLSIPKVTVTGTIAAVGYVGDNTTMAVKLTLTPAEGGNPFVRTVTLGSNGKFSLPLIPEGEYTITARGNCWMGTAPQNVTIAGDPCDIGTIVMTGGDGNGDNQVTFEDFAMLQNSYGQTGQSGVVNPLAGAAAATGGCGSLGITLLALMGLALCRLNGRSDA